MNKRISSVLKRYVGLLQSLCSGFQEERIKRIFRYSLLGAFAFGMAAHAYAYLNFEPVHDAVNYISSLAGGWEVSLGRFFQPLYGRIRGEYLMPWMNGMLSMLFIGLASFLINDLFDVENPWIAMLTAGFLTANATMTNLAMAFPYVVDVFAFALLLASAGAYVVIRLRNGLGVVLGSVFFAVSMGLYQSYVIFGCLVLAAYELLQAVKERDLLRKRGACWARCLLTVLLTAAVYAGFYRYFMWSYGTNMASAGSYNSPARLASMNLKELVPLFCAAYEDFMEYFLGVGSGKLNWIQMGTAGLCLVTGSLFIWYAVKEKLPLVNLLLIAAGIALFPGAAQVISVLADRGGMYLLTTHALFLMYPLLLSVLQRIRVQTKHAGTIEPMRHGAFRAGVWLLCGLILFGNIRTSNEMYTYRAVQYDKTLSYATRLMGRIESVPGYVRNETEVVFAGKLSAGLGSMKAPDESRWMVGTGSTAFTYLMVLHSFMNMLGENMNIPLDYSGMPDYGAMEEVQAMPAFPDPGCSRMIDGRVLVKLSD